MEHPRDSGSCCQGTSMQWTYNTPLPASPLSLALDVRTSHGPPELVARLQPVQVVPSDFVSQTG